MDHVPKSKFHQTEDTLMEKINGLSDKYLVSRSAIQHMKELVILRNRLTHDRVKTTLNQTDKARLYHSLDIVRKELDRYELEEKKKYQPQEEPGPGYGMILVGIAIAGVLLSAMAPH